MSACHTPTCEYTSGVKDCFPPLSQPRSPHLPGPCLMLAINMFPDPMETMGFISSPKTGVIPRLTALSHRSPKAQNTHTSKGMVRIILKHVQTRVSSRVTWMHMTFGVQGPHPWHMPPRLCSHRYTNAADKDQSASSSQQQHH